MFYAMQIFRAFTHDSLALMQQALRNKSEKGHRAGGFSIQGVVVTATFCWIASLDLPLAVCMIFGSFCIWFVVQTNESTTVLVIDEAASKPDSPQESDGQMRVIDAAAAKPAKLQRSVRLPKPDLDKDNGWVQHQSICAAITGNSFEADLATILSKMAPTPRSHDVVQQLAAQIKQCLNPCFTDADVHGWSHVNVLEDPGRFDMSSIDIVINTNLEAPVSFVQAHTSNVVMVPHWLREQRQFDQTKLTKLKKAALRVIAGDLSKRGFAFKCSAFRACDPKITMAVLGSQCHHTMYFDVIINAVESPFLKEMMGAVARADPRARDLILLVRLWAKVRKVCFMPKGYITPYAWSIMVIYFLQVRTAGEGPLLHPYEIVAHSAGHTLHARPRSKKGHAAGSTTTAVGTLLKEFFAFYSKDFRNHSEVVNIRSGMRRSSRRHYFQIIRGAQGQSIDVAPTIEDPVNPFRTIRSPTTQETLSRTRGELARAEALCASGSLTKLLEPWVEEVAMPSLCMAESEEGANADVLG